MTLAKFTQDYLDEGFPETYGDLTPRKVKKLIFYISEVLYIVGSSLHIDAPNRVITIEQGGKFFIKPKPEVYDLMKKYCDINDYEIVFSDNV